MGIIKSILFPEFVEEKEIIPEEKWKSMSAEERKAFGLQTEINNIKSEL